MKKSTIDCMENMIVQEITDMKSEQDASVRAEIYKACNDTAKVLVEQERVDKQAANDTKWYKSPVFVEIIKIGGMTLAQVIGIVATNGYMTKVLQFECDGHVPISMPGKKLADLFRLKSSM